MIIIRGLFGLLWTCHQEYESNYNTATMFTAISINMAATWLQPTYMMRPDPSHIETILARLQLMELAAGSPPTLTHIVSLERRWCIWQL